MSLFLSLLAFLVVNLSSQAESPPTVPSVTTNSPNSLLLSLNSYGKLDLLSRKLDFLLFPMNFFTFFDCTSSSSARNIENDTIFAIGYLASLVHQAQFHELSWIVANNRFDFNTQPSILNFSKVNILLPSAIAKKANIALDDSLATAFWDLLNFPLFDAVALHKKFQILIHGLVEDYDQMVFFKTHNEIMTEDYSNCPTVKELYQNLKSLNILFPNYPNKSWNIKDLFSVYQDRSIMSFYHSYYEVLSFPARLFFGFANLLKVNNELSTSPDHKYSEEEILAISFSVKTVFTYPQIVSDFFPIVRLPPNVSDLEPFYISNPKSFYKDFSTFSAITPLNNAFDMKLEFVKWEETGYNFHQIIVSDQTNSTAKILINLNSLSLDIRRSPSQTFLYYSSSKKIFSPLNEYPFLLKSLPTDLDVQSGDLILLKFGTFDSNVLGEALKYSKGYDNPFLFKGIMINAGFLLFEVNVQMIRQLKKEVSPPKNIVPT
jgi:hypothetical protein